ncbi:MAG TPA: TetR/AcrR family transcriptional regulator [Spirochaetia bacterium]|nr:TetR/AcrR family transcriptional regulator [Spirochaetia bacterium]
MAPRPDVSEKRKTEIVDAAARVFSRKGFSGARMDDIVEETGLSKGLLYWYFKGKDAIIVAILQRLIGPTLRRAGELAQAQGSARKRLLGFADGVIKEVEIMEKIMPITFEFYSLAFRNRTVKKAFGEFFRVFIKSLHAIIEQGIAEGEFHAVDPGAASTALMALFEGSLLLWVFDRTLVDLTNMRTAVELFIQGIERKP